MAALDAVGAGGARELERLGLDPVAGEDGKKQMRVSRTKKKLSWGNQCSVLQIFANF